MTNGVLVLAEQVRGQVSEITYEMLGVGRRLADGLQAPLALALLGTEAAALASVFQVADQVIVVDDTRLDLAATSSAAAAMRELMEKQGASLALIAGTNLSMGIGSYLAATTGAGFVNYCRGARVEGGDVNVTSQLFGGKILADLTLAGGKGILSICPGAFPAEAGKNGKTPEIRKAEVAVASSPVSFKRYIEPETGDVDITKANVLVAVGRGIQSQDNVAMAEELASALGGAVCASRPVIDQGWLPLSRQVGKSGMLVKPRLYLALGISGAPEHWEGMQGSQMIVAINTDAKAPIFDGAHFGVVGDALEYMPLLTERINAKKS